MWFTRAVLFFVVLSFSTMKAMEQEESAIKAMEEEGVVIIEPETMQEEAGPVWLSIISNDNVPFKVLKKVLEQSTILKNNLLAQERQVRSKRKRGETVEPNAENKLSIDADSQTVYLLIRLLRAKYGNIPLQQAIEEVKSEPSIAIGENSFPGNTLLKKKSLSTLIQAYYFGLDDIIAALAPELTNEMILQILNPQNFNLQILIAQNAPITENNINALAKLFSAIVKEYEKKITEINNKLENQILEKNVGENQKNQLANLINPITNKFADWLTLNLSQLKNSMPTLKKNLSQEAIALLKKIIPTIQNQESKIWSFPVTMGLSSVIINALTVSDKFIAILFYYKEETYVAIFDIEKKHEIKTIPLNKKHEAQNLLSLSPKNNYLAHLTNEGLFVYNIFGQLFRHIDAVRQGPFTKIVWQTDTVLIANVKRNPSIDAPETDLFFYDVFQNKIIKSYPNILNFSINPAKTTLAILSQIKELADKLFLGQHAEIFDATTHESLKQKTIQAYPYFTFNSDNLIAFQEQRKTGCSVTIYDARTLEHNLFCFFKSDFNVRKLYGSYLDTSFIIEYNTFDNQVKILDKITCGEQAILQTPILYDPLLSTDNKYLIVVTKNHFVEVYSMETIIKKLNASKLSALLPD